MITEFVGFLLEPILNWLFGIKPEPLAVRAQEVSDALGKTRALMEELQAEVQVRMDYMNSFSAQIEEAERCSAEVRLRAGLNEEQAQAVDAQLERALQARLSTLERKARRREWGLAMIGGLIIGLVVGVASILIVHFVFGF